MKKIKFLFLAISCLGNLYVYAGIGAQFNIDNDVKLLAAQQKAQEDTLKSSPPPSPKGILKNKKHGALPQEDGWIFGLLNCLQR